MKKGEYKMSTEIEKKTKISYKPLFRLLLDKNMKKSELVEEKLLSSSTLAKLGKNEYVALDVIEKLCVRFNVHIQEIVEVELNKE